MKMYLSKSGNLVYSGYMKEYEDMYGIVMQGNYFAAEMPTKKGLEDEAFDILEWYIKDDIERNQGVFLPGEKLKPKKGYEIWEFEISDELTAMVLEYINNGGKVINA